MTTITLGMTRSAFSTAAFAQLVRRLRHSNARYDQIARQFRSRFRPTHHAKARAYRAGLCIDTTSARAHPENFIPGQLPPVLDTSMAPTWLDTPRNPHRGDVQYPNSHDDAYSLLPSGAISKKATRRQRCRDGHSPEPPLVLRLPPLKQVNADYSCGTPFDGPVPGAPRLRPRQLPDDEGGVEELTLGPVSRHIVHEPDSLLEPASSGLCITIPSRNSKRKLQDLEGDGRTTLTQQPKRFMKARWDEPQIMVQ